MSRFTCNFPEKKGRETVDRETVECIQEGIRELKCRITTNKTEVITIKFREKSLKIKII